MGRRASSSVLEVKAGFSKIRTPSRSRLDDPNASPAPSSSGSPRTLGTPKNAPRRAASASPQPSSGSPRGTAAAVDVSLSREAYSKARNMLIAARQQSSVGLAEEEADEESKEGNGFKRVGKALITGMSEALTSRRSSGRNQNLMKSLMAAISREKIGAKIAELGLDDVVSEFLGHIYEGMIELQIEDFSGVEDALNGLLDSAVAGESSWMEFVGNLQGALMDCMDSMIKKNPTAFLEGKISRRQGELVESVVSAAREMGSEIAYTLKMRERQSGRGRTSVPTALPGMTEGRGLEGRGFTIGGGADGKHRDGKEGAGGDREAVHHFKKSVRKMFMMNAMDRAQQQEHGRGFHRFDGGPVVPQGPAFHTANRVAQRAHLHSRDLHEEAADGLGPRPEDGFTPSSGSSTPHAATSKDRPGSTGSGLAMSRAHTERSEGARSRGRAAHALAGTDGHHQEPSHAHSAHSQGRASDAFEFFNSLVEDAASPDGRSQSADQDRHSTSRGSASRGSTSRGRARLPGEGINAEVLENALGLGSSGGPGSLRQTSAPAGGSGGERSAKELMLNSILQEIDQAQEDSAGSLRAVRQDAAAGPPTPADAGDVIFARGAHDEGAHDDEDAALAKKKRGMNTILGDMLEAARDRQRRKDRGERVGEDPKDIAAFGQTWRRKSQMGQHPRHGLGEVPGGLVPGEEGAAELEGESGSGGEGTSRARRSQHDPPPVEVHGKAYTGFDWEMFHMMMRREGKRISIPIPWKPARRDMGHDNSRNQLSSGSDGEGDSDGKDSDLSPYSIRPPAPAAAASTGFRGAKVRPMGAIQQPHPASSTMNWHRVRRAKESVDLEGVYQNRALRFHRPFYESFPSYAPQLALIPVLGKKSKKPRGKRTESRQPIMPFRSTCFCRYPKRLLPEIETYPIVTEDFNDSVYSLSLEHSRASWSDTSTLLADPKPSKKRERSKGLREFHKHFSAVLP